MNTIKKLTESISNFLTEIANHYEIPSSEIVSTLMEINFYSLFQTLCREAEPVYAFRSYGKDDCLLNYWGEKLFPCKAILLYRMPDYVADEGRIATMHFLEVWLREDLTLAVTACFHPGEWTLPEVMGTLDMLFEKQYILTEEVETETRYRTETLTGERHAQDPITGAYLYDIWGDPIMEEYEYEDEVPYTHYTCTVTLENFDLSHVPVYVMTEEELGMYAVYMSTLGNRTDLFPDSEYIDRYDGTYPVYEIPPEALEDAEFAAIITEAEKYLGYPYVWGGSNPSTSFDCSGFVCWVVNHSGWSVGRLSAQGLCNICTPVSSSNVKPGDLVFFKGTYDTPGVSHVGIYVGNNRMIHCGDPISYTNLNSSYWQSHFYTYGRLP